MNKTLKIGCAIWLIFTLASNTIQGQQQIDPDKQITRSKWKGFTRLNLMIDQKEARLIKLKSLI